MTVEEEGDPRRGLCNTEETSALRFEDVRVLKSKGPSTCRVVKSSVC